MEYNTSLSKEERQRFTERLITLHTVLGEDTSTEYKHDIWTQRTPYGFFKYLRTGQSCGTAACAMGHALLHIDRFPGLQRLDNTAHEILVDAYGPYNPGIGAFDYFGPDTMKYIFSPYAYDGITTDIEAVTRAMAMQRIEDYITTVLGCRLIEA